MKSYWIYCYRCCRKLHALLFSIKAHNKKNDQSEDCIKIDIKGTKWIIKREQKQKMFPHFPTLYTILMFP